jgi:hypothetical protein
MLAPRHTLVALLLLPACRETFDYNSGNIDFDPDRPSVNEPGEVEPYSGADPIVIEAQEHFPTGLDLHKKVIWRTCTPNGGVCHNAKEYPDLRTPAEFASAFDAPCNIQPGEPTSVFDGCERPGDQVRFDAYGFGGDAMEIAFIEQLPGDDQEYGEGSVPLDAPGLHIHLVEPLPSERGESYGSGRFTRNHVEGDQVVTFNYASYDTQWFLIDPTHVFGRVQDYQLEAVQQLLASGVIEADPNRNGVVGSRMGFDVKLLAPGRPEDSYLIARLRGEMHDDPIPGSRMPLANAPLSIPEMLALFCLVEGWPNGGDQTFLSGPIDYNACSYSENPEDLNLLGEGVTWTARVAPILAANCGGCHSPEEAQAGLVLTGEGVYDRLLEPSTQLADVALIEPGVPEESYLYLKLTGDDRIIGNAMPYNPLTGEGRLTQAEIGDILTWISNGAVEDQ